MNEYNQAGSSIQPEKTTIRRQHSPVAGLVGLAFPGLGQIVRRNLIAAALVIVGTFVPILWTALLLNQRANDTVLAPNGEPPGHLLDGGLWDRISQVQTIPPEFIALALLGLTIHLLGAWAAFRGEVARAGDPE